MERDGPPKRVLLALKGTCHIESRAALHWALNTLPIRPGVDSVLLLHVVKAMKVIADGRLGLPYAAASPVLQSSVRHMAMAAGAREMQHYFQVCARNYVLADVQLSYGDRCPSIIQAVEEFGATHLVMGLGNKRGQLLHFWKGSLTARVVKAARCSVLLINRQSQLETTHEYTGERGSVGTNADGTRLPSALADTPPHDGPAWQHPDDELTPEAIAEREAAAERIQSEVDTWRRKWAASHGATLGSPEKVSAAPETVMVKSSQEGEGVGSDMVTGGTVSAPAAAAHMTAGNSSLTAGSGEELPTGRTLTVSEGILKHGTESLTADASKVLPTEETDGLLVEGGCSKEGRAIQRKGSISGSQRLWDNGQESKEENDDGVPLLFICCISQDVMVDPVVAADGHTYERIQIAQWLRRKASSPLTNLPLSDRGLIPNVSLKEAIKEWQEFHQKAGCEQVPAIGK